MSEKDEWHEEVTNSFSEDEVEDPQAKLNAASARLAALESRAAALNEWGNKRQEAENEERARRVASEKAEKETRAQFADLKQRLVYAESELSRLNGYMARVHEDDIVRDGLVEIEDINGKRMIPRHPPPQQFTSQPIGYEMQSTDGYNGRFEQRRQTHWTSY